METSDRKEGVAAGLWEHLHKTKAPIKGVQSTLSVLSSLNLESESTLEANQVFGSHWTLIDVHGQSDVSENKFTASQFKEISIQYSKFTRNQLGFTKVNNVTLTKAAVQSNHMSRSILSDVGVVQSTFSLNKLVKAELNCTWFHESEIAGNFFTNTQLLDCEFNSAFINGLHFENCRFQECVFANLSIKSDQPVLISGVHLKGIQIMNCMSVAEFCEILGISRDPVGVLKGDKYDN